MKILIVSDALHPLQLGGAPRIAWDTAVGLAKRGHTVTVLAAAARDALPKEHDGVHIQTIKPLSQKTAHYRSVFSTKRAREVIKIVEEVQPDLIHAHVIAWQCGYRWIPLARKKNIPVVITCHDVMAIACGRVAPDEDMIWLKDLGRMGLTWNPLRNLMIRKILNAHTKVLCVSDALCNFMEARGFTNLTTLHNGVDLDFWHEECSQEEARRRLNLPQNIPLFLLAGRLGIDKGSALVNETLPETAHLIVAGSIDFREIVRIRERMHLFKHQSPEQMRLLYAACDLSLVPSLCLDCFPTVCLEAMACSRPVIASSWGGAKEAVVNGETGWIIDPLKPAMLRERMEWCAAHRHELPAFGRAGRERMEERFSQERYLDEMEKVYRTHGE